MKKVLVLSSLIFLGALVVMFTPPSPLSTDPYAVPDREPFDGSLLPKRAMKAVCQLGHPVMISRLDDNLPVRMVIFPGPIREHPGEGAEVVNYVGYYVDNPPNPHGDALTLVHSVDEYKAKSLPEELEPYRLEQIDGGVPDKTAKLKEMLGEPDVVIARSNPERDRLIWERRLCFEDTLVYELWVEAIDGKIVKAGASKSPPKPAREI